MMKLFRENYEQNSSFKMEKAEGYSATSDIGNVSTVVPTIHPWIAIGNDRNLPLHNKDFAEAVMTEQAGEEMVHSAVALAWTAYDLFSDAQKLAEVKNEFQSN